MKRLDSNPSQTIDIPTDQYLKRLKYMAVHEIGHDVISSDHMKLATWVNSRTGYELILGMHCTDPSCVMYEIVDINAPSPEEGYMLLGEEKRFNAGMDDVLDRIYPNFFCEDCRFGIEVDERFEL